MNVLSAKVRFELVKHSTIISRLFEEFKSIGTNALLLTELLYYLKRVFCFYEANAQLTFPRVGNADAYQRNKGNRRFV